MGPLGDGEVDVDGEGVPTVGSGLLQRDAVNGDVSECLTVRTVKSDVHVTRSHEVADARELLVARGTSGKGGEASVEVFLDLFEFGFHASGGKMLLGQVGKRWSV